MNQFQTIFVFTLLLPFIFGKDCWDVSQDEEYQLECYGPNGREEEMNACKREDCQGDVILMEFYLENDSQACAAENPEDQCAKVLCEWNVEGIISPEVINYIACKTGECCFSNTYTINFIILLSFLLWFIH